MPHNAYLARCLALAELGGRKVFPNPKVGSIIVYQDRIIGEGYHPYAGGPHGEVSAVQSVKEADRPLLPKSTLYVSLEPCNFFGKTPPCTDLILSNKIPHVVVGCLDPNPKVAGKGVEKLRRHGVKVELAEDPTPFQEINRHFFVNQLYKRPYITLKWAESSDGFIARWDNEGNPAPVAITGKRSNLWVHKLRMQHHAIMVGRKTAAIDNPQLSNRHFYGGSPIRIVWDQSLRLPQSLRMFTDNSPTIVLNRMKNEQQGKVRYYQPPTETAWESLKTMLEYLYQDLGICSIFVEGGRHLLQQFIETEQFDELWHFRGKNALGEGLVAPRFSGDYNESFTLQEDKVSVVRKAIYKY